VVTGSVKGGLPEATSSSAWYALAVLAITAMLSYTDRYILNVVIDSIRADLGLTDVAASLAQGPAFALVYGFLAIPFGRLADSWNRRAIILIALALWSLATISCGLARGLTQLLLLRFLVGVGEAGFFPCAVSFLSDAFPPQRRGIALGTLLMGAALGNGIAVIAGSTLLGAFNLGVHWPLLPSPAPWRGVLVVIGACGAPVILLAAWLREPPRRVGAAESGPDHGLRALFRGQGRALVLILAALALMSTLDAAASAWTPAFFVRRLGFSPRQLASQLGLTVTIAGAIGYLIGGQVADYLDRSYGPDSRLALGAGCAISILPLLAYTQASANLSLALYGALTLSIAIFIVAVSSAFLRRVPSSLQGSATAMMALTMILAGMAAGPTLVAFLTERVLGDPRSVGTSIMIVGVCVTLPIAALTWIARRA